MTPKSFTALKAHPKVDSLSYEPCTSSKQLKTSWSHDDEGKHLITGSTIAQIKEQLGEVQICNCDQCLQLKRSG